MDEEKYIDFDEAMELAGFGKFNVGTLLLCGFMMMGMIFDSLGLGYIMPAAQCDLKLNITEKGWLGAIPFIAIILTSHMWGWFADTKGRRATLMYSMLIGATLTIISSFCTSLTSFAIMKLISGLFNSSTGAISIVYLAEFNSKRHEGKVVTLGSSFIPIATVILPIIAWGMLPLDFAWPINMLGIDYKPWRLLIVVCALPNIFCGIALLCGVPESPKLLHAIGKTEEAMAVIRKIAKINNNSENIPYSQRLKKSNQVNEETVSVFESMKEHTIPLFKKPFLIWTLIVFVAQFTNFACANGFYIWYPQIFNKMSQQTGNLSLSESTICEIYYNSPTEAPVFNISRPIVIDPKLLSCDDTVDVSTYQRSIILALIFCPSAFIATFLVNILGRKRMLLSMSFVAGVSGLIAGYVPNFHIVIVLLGLFQMSSTCISLVCVVILGLFPTKFKAMTVSLAFLIGRFGSIFGSNVIGIMMEKTCTGTFLLFGSMLLGSTLLCFLFLPSEVQHEDTNKSQQEDVQERLIELKVLTNNQNHNKK